MSGDENPSDTGSNFSLGVNELRRAKDAQAKDAQRPAAETEPPEVKTEDPGVDPYNTSGRFDRKKAWARVTKR